MKIKLFIIPLSFLILFGCSTDTSVDKNLYNDSEDLIKLIYNTIENEDSINITEEVDFAVDKYKSKYELTEDQWTDDEWDLLYSTNEIYNNYLEYYISKDEKYLKNFYTNVERINTEYNMKF